MSSPLLLFLIAVAAFPLGYTIWTSLTDQAVSNPVTKFVGLENFGTVLGDRVFWASLWFTVRYTAIVTAAELLLGTSLAILFDRVFPGKRVLLSVILVPIMTAPVLVGVAYELLLNQDIGVLPDLLARVGIRVSLFAPGSVQIVLMAIDILQWTPFVFLVVYSALQTVPNDLYEAADVDGATYARIVRSIVLPLVQPIIVVAGFIRAINAFRTFDVIYVLTGGGPGALTTTTSIYVYQQAFTNGQFGVGAAASILMAGILLPFLPLVVPRLVQAQLGRHEVRGA
jgi:multiple sugar transport system permease protein